MNRTRKALAGLVATATVAAPLATVMATPAHAAARPYISSRMPWGLWFSPNKDGSQDKLKMSVSVSQASAVTVKVRRTKTE